MKFFVVFAYILAAASAGIIAPVAPIHLPLIGPNGVPVDTAEVQHARAAHAVHKAEVHLRNGDVTVVTPVDAHTVVVTPVVGRHAVATPIVAHATVTAPVVVASAPQHLPIIDSTGVPVDTAEVQHARAAHAVHKAEAHARNGDVAVVTTPVVAHHAYAHPFFAHHLVRRGLLAALPVAVANVIPAAYSTTLGVPAVTTDGIPLETPGVVAAKTSHFPAHAEALARNSPIITTVVAHHPVAALVGVAPTSQHIPIIDSTGVPVDTAEVQHARAAHAVHKAEAHVRNGDVAVVATPVIAHHTAAIPVVAHSAVSHSSVAHPLLAHHLVRRGVYAAVPIAVAHTIPAAYPTTLGLPVVTSDGVPLETPEVAAAKSNHFAAHAQALTRNSLIVSHVGAVVPVATL